MTETIRCTEDLRRGYSWLRMLQEHVDEFDDKRLTRELIRDQKRAIRKYYRQQAERELANSDRRVIKDDGIDGCIIRIDMLDDFGSIDEARAWFEEYEYIHYQPSYYDCTGQCFTGWYSIFQHPDGHYIAYHRIACDC